LGLSVLVADGDDADTLRVAAGHVSGTALPGAKGNAVLAGHRDTAFRALRGIRRGDLVRFESGRTYEYVVECTRIVRPEDTDVLRASSDSRLTMITCYPFRYVGNAPKRFIVQAHLKGAS
jgi:sortase A